VVYAIIVLALVVSILNYSVDHKSLDTILAETKPNPEDIKTMGYERAMECARDFATYFYKYEHNQLSPNDTTFDDLMLQYYPDQA